MPDGPYRRTPVSYYLQDHPNPNTPQYGWERARLGEPGVHLSGVVGVHTSEAITDFEGVDNNAENNAAFLGRRTDYGSYHTTGDADSIVPLVHPRYATWADTTNNAHAMSVSGCLQAARWLEMTPERRRAVVTNMAVAAARMVQTAVADGYLAAPTPAVRISAAEAISGSRPGFYGHGETNPGTRYDPGAHFDWTLFLSTYAAAVGGINPQGTTEEDDMFNDADRGALAELHEALPRLKQILEALDIRTGNEDEGNLAIAAKVLSERINYATHPDGTPMKIAVQGDIDAVLRAVAGVGAGEVDVQHLADLLKVNLAPGVADELSKRLAS
jgi:hypothetical protein